MHNDIQTEINDRRRQQLTMELAACVLRNQLYGEIPEKREKEAQKKLLMEAAVESQHMRVEIENLVAEARRPVPLNIAIRQEGQPND